MTTENQNAWARHLFLAHPRKMSLVVLLVSGTLIYLCYVSPVSQALNGAQEIQISLKGSIAGVIMGVLGLCYLGGGARFAAIFHPAPTESKMPLYVAIVLLLLVSAGVFAALVAYLMRLGYQF